MDEILSGYTLMVDQLESIFVQVLFVFSIQSWLHIEFSIQWKYRAGTKFFGGHNFLIIIVN